MGGFVLWLLAVASLATDADKLAQYRRTAANAYQNEDFDLALLSLHRLESLGALTDSERFQYAVLLDRTGRPSEAYERMRRIAPADKTGLVPQAHFWMAMRSLRPAPPAEPDPRTAEIHLRRVLEGDANNIQAKHYLGNLYFEWQRYTDALPYLEATVARFPEQRLRLAKAYLFAGKREDARREAKRSLEAELAALKGMPDTKRTRLAAAESALFLEQYQQSATLLAEGFERTNDPDYQLALSKVYVKWSEAMEQRGDFYKSMYMMQLGLEINPQNPELLRRLLLVMHARDAQTAEARAMLENVLARGGNYWLVHLMLAVDASIEADWPVAQHHIESASKLSPKHPAVASTYAWILLHHDPPDLERALEQANLALQVWPGHPETSDTRGRILLQMGQARESLDDFRIALAAMPNHPDVHMAIAEAYDRLALDRLAARHRELANQASRK